MALREPTLDDVFLELTGHAAEVDGDADGRRRRRRRAGATSTPEEPMSASTTDRRHRARARRRRERPAARGRATRVTMAWRNLLNIRRNPQLLVFATIQPVIFVLMFRYVFGGRDRQRAAAAPYVNFLMPGIFVQTVVFGSLTTGVGLAEDLQKGLDRPVPLVADGPLGGARRPHARRPRAQRLRGPADVRRGLRSSGGARRRNVGRRRRRHRASCSRSRTRCRGCSRSSGSSRRDAETAQAASFPILAPLVFASSAFVPVVDDARAGSRRSRSTSRCRSWSTRCAA